MAIYFVYVLECHDGTLYTGITTDTERRFLEHKEGKGGRYTRSRGVKKIVYEEQQPDRATASRREFMIKKLSRDQKLKLIKVNS